MDTETRTAGRLALSGEGGICVGFASRGRPALLGTVVDLLSRQTLPPASVILSCVTAEDAGPLAARHDIVTLTGPPGSSRQRNAIIDRVPATADIVVFFDDDFVFHPTWLEAVERVFREQPDVAAVTGHVLADGIKGPGISFEEAGRIVAAHHDASSEPWSIENYPP